MSKSIQRVNSVATSRVGGGTVTTAGNLVFQVIPDGRFVAYSADKGEKLLDFQTGLKGGMARQSPICSMEDSTSPSWAARDRYFLHCLASLRRQRAPFPVMCQRVRRPYPSC